MYSILLLIYRKHSINIFPLMFQLLLEENDTTRLKTQPALGQPIILIHHHFPCKCKQRIYHFLMPHLDYLLSYQCFFLIWTPNIFIHMINSDKTLNFYLMHDSKFPTFIITSSHHFPVVKKVAIRFH